MLVSQKGFCLETALKNLEKLTICFVEVFRALHKNLCVFDFLPPMADMRCNMMASHLLPWNMMAIYAPHKIRVDPFDLFCVRGGGFFQSFSMPEGRTTVFRQDKTTRQVYFKYCEPYQREIFLATKRLKSFFRFSQSDSRRAHEDSSKSDFFDVWRATVPPPFNKDEVLGRRIGDLCKFILLTYSVYRLDYSFEDQRSGRAPRNDEEQHRADFRQMKGLKRSIHKQVKLYHGV